MVCPSGPVDWNSALSRTCGVCLPLLATVPPHHHRLLQCWLKYGIFFLLAGAVLVSAVLLFVMTPETKNVPLEQVSQVSGLAASLCVPMGCDLHGYKAWALSAVAQSYCPAQQTRHLPSKPCSGADALLK